MTNQDTILEQNKFSPTALLELFVLDGTSIGMETPFYFHNGLNILSQPVIFNGIIYTPFPVKFSDFSTDGKGSLPRPKISVSNINGFISALLLQEQNLIGATVIRRRVFAKYIDAVNYPNNISPYSPDPTAAYPDENWQINRKIVENKEMVQWELVSPLETQNVKLPRRQIIAGVCGPPWKYRDMGTCGYSGIPIADKNNKVFGSGGYGFTLSDKGAYSVFSTYNIGDYVYIYSTLPQFLNIKIYYVCAANGTIGQSPVSNPSKWIQDSCAKNCAACKLRFPNVPLRGGFFPGSTRAPWLSLK